MSAYDEKFEGLLHDPIDKATHIRNHASRAENIAKRLVPNLPRNILDEIREHHQRRVKITWADYNASAANRGLLPYRVEISEISFQNPFSGFIIKLRRFQRGLTTVHEEEFECIGSYPDDFNSVFWNLIREYYRVYLGVNQALAQSLFILPEDTRIPSSPILSHLTMTSALAKCRENFYLVYIDIGGVQEFISGARKTRDFWAGSFICSILSASVIRYLVNRFGPDSVIMPWILEIPLVEAFVFKRAQPSRDVLLPLIPSTITALIPYIPESSLKPSEFVNKVKEEIREELQRTWERILDEYIDELKKLGIMSINAAQIKSQFAFEKIFPKVRILIIDYHKTSTSNLIQILDNLGHYQDIRNIPYHKDKRCNQQQNCLDYKHQPLENFENYVKIQQIGSEFVKNTIEFKGTPESDTTKNCQACGKHRQAVLLNNEWSSLEEKHIIDYGERLCHLCLLKRLLGRFVHRILGFKSGIKVMIPSTSDLGTVWFKASLVSLYLAALKNENTKKYIESILQELAKCLKDLAKECDLDWRIEECTELSWPLFAALFKFLGEDIRDYLVTIVCAPGELFDLESVRALISREDSKKKEKKNEESVNSETGTLNKKPINSKIEALERVLKKIAEIPEKYDRELIDEAKKFLAKAILEVLLGGDGYTKVHKEHIEIYEDILKKFFELFPDVEGDKNDGFIRAIPIALRPQDSLRFCIIRGDGDSIGRWINGEKCMPWVLMHHPDMIRSVQSLQNMNQNILKRPRPTSPAYFSTLSMTLSYNALLISRIIDAFGGFLIYTGGDDVLALVPPEVWHLVYLILRYTFSCEIILNKALRRYAEGIYSYGMSWRATQSYGVVIAHHKADLRWVIEYSRRLEEKSKDFSSRDNSKLKDAISVALLGRGVVIRETEALPNTLIKKEKSPHTIIKKEKQFYTVSEFDEILREEIESKVFSHDVLNTYMQHVTKLCTEIQSNRLGGDFAFTGILPRTYNLADISKINNVYEVYSLPIFGYYISYLVLNELLSRGGLKLLEELYETALQRDLEAADLHLLEYRLSRRISEALRNKLLSIILNNVRILSDLSKLFNSNLLSVFYLAEIFRRCLIHCIVG